ncbi:uncharacterized protein HMPREF1541_07942 [Cyphellophora europaea CBS 101466]|uniref:Endosomal/vacuolar adapter protein YPT35 n=1 Tax=Cyphellophora europaea (strain CBS 101466) TaxID=1220924 RepID=W2RMK8_CYPE1|nr:uncharacterized protein HMPREF1541_07942 [Cyphellophora europaea CBS 101466]ETN36954.1 hypothetical protein HMPREF1541_07942 [Cyphellophora europaea CBS 101466]
MENDRFPELATESSEPTAEVTTKRHSALSPPYWQHKRTDSNATQTSLHPPPISLEDHTAPESPSKSSLWAKSISIDDYVIVNGNPTGIGAYVVWNCIVQTLDGGPLTIRKRYSEFVDLRYRLNKNFPQSTRTSLPPLPPKSAIYKFRPSFLEKRRQGLAYFLTCVMLNPEYAGSDAVKDFIFGHL